MTTRTTTNTVTFAHPFLLKGIDRILPAGDYRVVTDEELIEGVSFPVYRRVSTMIFVPGQNASSVEMVAIDPQEAPGVSGAGPKPWRLVFEIKAREASIAGCMVLQLPSLPLPGHTPDHS